MKIAHKTDIGRVRSSNEDSASVQTDLNGLTLAIVADGMGGHQAGDIASRMAIDVIQEELQKLQNDMSVPDYHQMLRSAIALANDKIRQSASENPKYRGMGTTVVVAVANEKRIFVAHVGDSRAYKISSAGLCQLTEDHTLVNELVKRGQLSEEEAMQHPRRNVLTRALGTDVNLQIDISDVEWAEHEVLMLCSDGLTGAVDNEEMTRILQSSHDLDWKVDALVHRALEAGGDDNITVTLIANEKVDQDEGVGR